jgi:hypothetical protein
MTLYIILGIATGIIVILLIVVLVVVFRRRDSGVTNSPDRSKKGYVKGNVKGGNKTGQNSFDFDCVKLSLSLLTIFIFFLIFSRSRQTGQG